MTRGVFLVKRTYFRAIYYSEGIGNIDGGGVHKTTVAQISWVQNRSRSVPERYLNQRLLAEVSGARAKQGGHNLADADRIGCGGERRDNSQLQRAQKNRGVVFPHP